MFSLQVKNHSWPYHVPLRNIVYAFHETPKEELERLKEQDIIVLLGMDEMFEWCNSFVLVPKRNGKV